MNSARNGDDVVHDVIIMTITRFSGSRTVHSRASSVSPSSSQHLRLSTITKYVINVVVSVLLAMSSLRAVAGHSNDTAATSPGGPIK